MSSLKDKDQYRKWQTYTRRGRGNKQAKLRRDKTTSSRELRYFRLEIFEIRLGIFKLLRNINAFETAIEL